jgi:DNA invertase Pin-like site-specific DNA recombinase
MTQPSSIVAYVRVSTTEQASEGVSLDMQTRAIHAWAEAMGHEIVAVYREEGVSAASLERPQLREAMRHALKPSADGLVVLKLDRLTRSVQDLARLMDEFNAEGKALISVRDSLDTTSAGGRLVANIMASVAQWEREIISERTKDALAEKRRQGVRLGRPPSESVSDAVAADVRRLSADGQSQRAIASAFGLKVSTVRRLVA